MKNLFYVTFIFIIQAPSVLACNNKVNPNKVIFFIDTNESDLEIETAEKAACARGERVVVAPKNYKDYRKYTKEIEKTRSAYESCARTNGHDNCTNMHNSYSDARKKLNNFISSQPALNESIKQSLSEIKNSKSKIQSLIISGHNGGGHFGGYKGSFSRSKLQFMMTSLEGINEIKSLMLLGCYTGVQNEVMEWKKLIPNVKLIGGYDDSAPLSIRPQGHKYLADLLVKEKQLLKHSDEKKLTDFAKANLQSLFNVRSALYLQCSEGDNEFYYGSKKQDQKFSKISMAACADESVIANLASEINKYNDGTLEVPTNTATGELRRLYNLGRSHEHCAGMTSHIVDMNQVFNLLFYDGVKKSFGHYYKQDLETVEKDFASLKIEDLEKAVAERIKESEKLIKDHEAMRSSKKSMMTLALNMINSKQVSSILWPRESFKWFKLDKS